MENYTKYRLKEIDELAPFLAGTDKIFVVACNKCFKEFETVDEPDCGEFVKMAEAQGKTVTGSVQVDFLCNKTQTEKKLKDLIPEGTESIFVVSCGLGVQTIASMVDLPVYAAANSLNYRGHHGMALTKKSCDACAQCYLNMTGGVCPIVDCAKSLINGQCGGAKNGKCEVDPNKDCAWEKINKRLSRQGRLAELKSQPVQLRDYSKVNFKVINDYVQAIRESRFAGYYGGVHPSEKKELCENEPLLRFPESDIMVIPLSQHSGAPAKPVVQVGDYVKVGQVIGEPAAFISAYVHSSVSGKVLAIEERVHPATRGGLSVVIENDKKYVVDESVKPKGDLSTLSKEDIVNIVKEAGIAGMGGAGFPTSVKLAPGKPIEAVLLNGCECEPMLTADHKLLLHYADEVIFGLKAVMKAVEAPKGIIVIEDNKPDAVELLKSKCEAYDDIEVTVAKTKYPQGAEKMLIKRVLGRMVPSGGLPADVGAVVCNVSTVKAISDAIQKGMPLIERVVSVTGERIRKPGNYIIRIGTNVKEVIDYCGGIVGDDYIVKMGGPMMGILLPSVDVSVIKGTNGIIAIEKDESEAVACIKCGRCVDVCPMELSPLYFAKYHDEENWQGMKDKNVMDCMECRCCEYICSSKIPLLSKIKAGKAAVRGMK
ncbi:MAG: electron transport complex subunit RsxC [Oscillospiraceae bacterium]|nr:electron transport complex subunit RsxC [Oscillospiraceae bacterium]